jgi:hypothetical protein
MNEPETEDVLVLAEIIREVDGKNRKEAAALAESILSHHKFKLLSKEKKNA